MQVLRSRIIQSVTILEKLCPNKLYFCKNNPIFTSAPQFKKRKSKDEQVTKQGFQYPTKSVLEPVKIWHNMTVTDLANALGKDVDHVFEALSLSGLGHQYGKVDSNIEDANVIKDVVKKSGRKCNIIATPDSSSKPSFENRDATLQEPACYEKMKKRSPVVTIMGHVDHGKTSLLDAIRQSSVVESEFGGITQHIGAFSVTLPSGEKITFLDTPGHAAFTAMRERGANVTDIVILVVAADDGVMEQTIQSIRMANSAKVPIVVAINKVDKPNANVERTKKMLVEQGLHLEDYGGDVQVVPVSAVTGQNLSQLSEAVVALAELLDLRADYEGFVEGVVVESLTDPGRGKLSTAIIKRGTLKKGALLVAGTAWAKVRAMFDDAGKTIGVAPPATAVQIIGWRDLPGVGENIIQVESEKRVNEVMRLRLQREMSLKQEVDQEAINKKIVEHLTEYKSQLETKRKLGKFRIKPTGPRQKEINWNESQPYVNVIVKGDVVGSVEAILDVLQTYDCVDECKLDVVHYGVGPVTESDIDLATTFKDGVSLNLVMVLAIIYAFNVTVPAPILNKIKENGISFKQQNVIYHLIDDLKQLISSRIRPKDVEEIIGEAKVQQAFLVTEGKKKVPVAGCRCNRGELKKEGRFKIIRDGKTIYDGNVVSMRHLKNEVGTVKKDVECGLMFDDSPDLEAGDSVHCYKLTAQPQVTSWNPGF